jgi:hypothetical protein
MSKPMSRAANDPVESNRQARTYDATKLHYQRLGLCRFCAAQASWGHQLGFSRVKPPCDECQPFVDTFPTAKPGRWRSDSPRRGAEFSSSVRHGWVAGALGDEFLTTVLVHAPAGRPRLAASMNAPLGALLNSSETRRRAGLFA